MAFFALTMFLPRWWLSAERGRSDRFSLFPIIANGTVAFIFMAIWKNNQFGGAEPPGYLGLAIAGDSKKRPWPGLDAIGLYWHFVDVVWVFVLSVVYILPRLR